MAFFDFLESYFDWDTLELFGLRIPFELDFAEELGIPQTFENIGMESHNALKNLNTVGLFLFIMVVRLFLMELVRCCYCKRIYEAVKVTSEEIIAISLECYLEYVLVSWITLKFGYDFSKNGETIGLSMACFCAFLVLCVNITVFRATFN